MVKRIFCLLAAVFLFTASVFASDSSDHPNTLGVVQQDLSFLGLNYYNSMATGVKSYYIANDNKVDKLLRTTAASPIDLSNKHLYLFFSCPDISSMTLSKCFFSLAGDVTFSTLRFYGANLSGDYYYLTRICDLTLGSSRTMGDISYYQLDPFSFENDGFDALVIYGLVESGTLIHTFSVSSAATVSGSSSDVFYLDQVYFYPPTYMVKASVKLSEITSQPLFQYYDSYMTIYPYSAGVEFGSIDGTVSSDDYGQLMGTVYGSSTISLNETGSFTPSSSSLTMASAALSVSYGSDGGLVDEVFVQGETLDQIAGDMSKIVEDMQAKQDTANDIGGATSEDQITGTQETISTGTAALDTFSNSAVSGLTDVSAQMQGYSALLAATVPSMLAFGEGDPLYWQLIGSISLAAIVIIARGLLRR